MFSVERGNNWVNERKNVASVSEYLLHFNFVGLCHSDLIFFRCGLLNIKLK